MTHYSKEINEYMIDCIVSGKHTVTDENMEDKLKNLEQLVRAFSIAL